VAESRDLPSSRIPDIRHIAAIDRNRKKDGKII